MAEAIIRTTEDNGTNTLSDNRLSLTMVEGGVTYQLNVDRIEGDAILIIDRPEGNDTRVPVNFEEANALLNEAIARGEWNAAWRLRNESRAGDEAREVHTTITPNQLTYLNRGDGNRDGYLTTVTNYDSQNTPRDPSDDSTVVSLTGLHGQDPLILTIIRSSDTPYAHLSGSARGSFERTVDAAAAERLVQEQGVNITHDQLMGLPAPAGRGEGRTRERE